MSENKALLYKASRIAGDMLGEKRDCSVIAVSIATGVSYIDAHKEMKRLGRRDRQGARKSAIKNAIRNKGVKLTFQQIDFYNKYTRRYQRYTPKTLPKAYPEGTYLVFVRGHVFTMVDGEIQDWTDGRSHRVQEIYKVENS